MLTTSSRLLKLLGLLQTPRDWTGPQLAERLAVSARTIRNDIAKLRELGYPVDGAPGLTGGYRLGSGGQLPPLLLDDEEAVAVALGLHAAAVGTIAGVEETSLRALTKIAQLLPDRLRGRVQSLQTVSAVIPTGGPKVDSDLLQQVALACRNREGIRFDYISGREATGGEPADEPTPIRRAEPYQLVHRRGRWYLLAFDLDRDDWRTFRLDRMRLRVPGGARFAARPIPGGDAAEFVSDRIQALTRRYTARVRLHAGIGEVRPWFAPSWGELQPISEDRCLLLLTNDSYESMAVGLGLTGLEFEILEPVELRDMLQDLAGRLQRGATSAVSRD